MMSASHFQQQTVDPAAPPCHQVGVCLCCAWGKNAYAFRNRFLRAMKGIFKRGSQEREWLHARRIVARLHGRREGNNSPWALAVLGPEATALDKVLYLHIGAHSWTPYCSTYVRLEEVAVVNDACDHKLLKA